MKTVLAMMTLVFMSSTVFAAEQMPFPHMQAMATANQMNRLKTVGNYTTWIANRVPKDQMSAFKAFLKAKGLNASTPFPKMTADKEKACFDKTHCLSYAGESVSINGVNFKVEKKTFGKVVTDLCAKIGCETKTAQLTLIPEAHAMSQTMTTLLGLVGGGALGYFAADALGIKKSTGLLGGSIVGGLAGYFLGSEDKAVCNGNCSTSCNNDQYSFTPSQPSGPYYGQQSPPYTINNQSYYHQYGQYPPPCQYQGGPTPGATDLQIALNSPPQQNYCQQSGCQQLPPYQPGNYQYSPGNNYNNGQPADVRTVSSEKKDAVKKEESKDAKGK